MLPSWSAAASAQAPTSSPAAPPVPARLTATVDAGAATVRYDEFLRSGVVSLSPSGRLDLARGSVMASGALSRFESGNRSLQGTLAGTLLLPLGARASVEAGATGTSVYYSGAEAAGELGGEHAGNLLGVLRVHRLGTRWGAWAGATGGLVTDGFQREGVGVGELALWTLWRGLSASAALRPTLLSGTIFGDAELTARWSWRGRLDLSGSMGARAGPSALGARAWGEVGAIAWLAPHLALVAGYGRYPADVLQGAPGARYATAAVRVASRPPPRLEAAARRPARDARLAPLALLRALPADDFSARPLADGRTLVRVRAPEAGLVELMGDFTDWEPVPLSRAPDGTWERAFALPPGTFRFNVRRDGGPWEVPTGATRIADDFGGEAALLVVG